MKTFSTGVIFGLFGAVAVSISFASNWPAWVMFIAWVSYYIFGKTVKTSFRAFLQIALGMTMGLCIQASGMYLTGFLGSFGLPVAVFFFIGSLAYIAKIDGLSNIPAWFLGLIIFFGIHPPIQATAILELFVPIIFGFVFACLNDMAVERVMRAEQ